LMAAGLWQKAEQDLCIQVHGAAPDPLVWEHSARVARIAEHIARLPGIPKDSLSSESLSAAALYHDIGWVLQVHAGQLSRDELFLRPTTDTCRDMAADWIQVHLKGIVPGGVIERAMAAIRQASDRKSSLIEAQILSDADNLDQIGPLAIERMIRKCRCDGRTMDHMVAGWERQEEYHYWQARIKESIRFEAVRAIAERRHQTLREFMAGLSLSLKQADLATIVGPQQGRRSSASTEAHPIQTT
jgi:HD superfamily phosphodiesterase